jgi:serine/threonine-protein kinase
VDGIGLYPAPPSRSPLSARAFGDQLLLGELIGRGGMSRVFRGWVRGTGHEVAVKILRDDLASRPEAVQRFIRERDLLAAVSSPHVVRVHDLVVDGDELGIVMDLVPGGHLRQAVAYPCPLATAVELAAQIADGLAAVHATGVVHRDLKPENVLVDGDGSGGVCLRLTDFGISRLVDTTLTQTTVTGTPGYLAPEVAAGARPAAAADVYALGIVLYELCTGRAPFTADNPLVLILAHTRREVPRPGGMPDALWSLLAAMLAKDPQARPGAAAIADALRVLTPGLAGMPPCEPPDSDPVDLSEDGYEFAPPTVAGQVPSGYELAPPTVAGQAQQAGPPRMPDGVQIMVPEGATAPGPPLAAELAPRRAGGYGAPADPGDWRDGGRRGVRDALTRVPPWGRVLAAAVAILAVGIATVGVRNSLTASDDVTPTPEPTVTSSVQEPDPVPTEPSLPVPATPSSTSQEPTPTSRTTERSPSSRASSSSPTASSPTARTSGSASPSASPTLPPAVPLLARSVPSSMELHSSDGHVILTVSGLRPGSGTMASLRVRYGGSIHQVPLGTSAATSYDTTIDGLTNGTKYSFRAEACNTAQLCSTSPPVEFTPYKAPDVPRPRMKLGTGTTVTVSWDAIKRNHNPGKTRCTISVTGSPSESGLPDGKKASADGDRLTFTGTPGSTYVATLSCTTEDVADGASSSSPILVPSQGSASPSSQPEPAGRP